MQRHCLSRQGPGTLAPVAGDGKLLQRGPARASLAAMSAKHMPDLDLSGSCDCGAVTLAIKGRPVSMFQCSCHNCQRASGSGHSSIVLFPADDLAVNGATTSYARPANSGATFTRHFCPECGTTLFALSSRAPALRLVPAGLFAGRNDWFAPNQLIFARSQAAWDLIDEHIPHHTAYRPERSS
ncbi:GFA family protein [Devosia sp. CAU 1758]